MARADRILERMHERQRERRAEAVIPTARNLRRVEEREAAEQVRQRYRELYGGLETLVGYDYAALEERVVTTQRARREEEVSDSISTFRSVMLEEIARRLGVADREADPDAAFKRELRDRIRRFSFATAYGADDMRVVEEMREIIAFVDAHETEKTRQRDAIVVTRSLHFGDEE